MHLIRPLSIADYDALIELMQHTPGVSFRDADSRASTARYLERNPGLSFVCEADGLIVACLMSGHDGRRGYLQHLIVRPDYRRRGIARALVERCLDELEKLGILKCHLDVFRSNADALAYWEKQGWTRRTDIHRYSLVRSGRENA